MSTDGTKYTGDFSNDVKHGYGVEEGPDGSYFEGYHKFGLKEGAAYMKLNDGSEFFGEF